MPEFDESQLLDEALRRHRAGRLGEAESLYRAVLAGRPDHLGAWVNLGAALRAFGRLDEAVDCLHRAIAIAPGSPQAHNNLGNVLRDMGRLDEAMAAYRAALDASPEDAEAHVNLGAALKDAGRIGDSIACLRRALELRPGLVEAHSNLVYVMRFDPRESDRTILAECRRWAERFGAAAGEGQTFGASDRGSGRRLRIGYVGAEFRDHCQSFFMAPVLEHHDRERFEVHCYASVVRPDAVTQRLRRAAERWHDVLGSRDEAVAAQVRGDRIDILVDLTMHMAGCRLGVFARRPAPVQVTWLAYPGTTGVGAMDYRLTDPHLDPPGTNDDLYAERSVRLPETFWCYDPLCEGPAVNALPLLSEGCVTFGCLNNFAKVNAGSLQMWARVLARVPGSRLLVLAPEGEHRAVAARVLSAAGVAEDRVEFVAPRPRAEYLALYHRIDICLDTLPYNGHTTSLDAFWMGVPVVTRAAGTGEGGGTVVGRAGVSQLMNLGMPELIGRSDEDFVRIAAGLAGDYARLAALRETLRGRLRASPLMDGRRFVRGLEAAYREMCKRIHEPRRDTTATSAART